MTAKIRIAIILSVIIVILGSGIIYSTLTQSTEAVSTEVDSGDTIYQLTWNTDGIELHDNGWTVTNNLGYTITVDTGFVVSYSAQLVECEDHTHDETAFLGDVFATNSAEAGHGDEYDPSLYAYPVIEDFANPSNIIFGRVTAPAINYCQGHYLIAKAHAEIEDLPSDVDMVGASLYVSGTYIAPNSDERVVFEINTHLANGVLEDLVGSDDGNSAHLAIGENIAIVAIQRELAPLFDEVNFETMTDSDAGKSILWSLIGHTDIVVMSAHRH